MTNEEAIEILKQDIDLIIFDETTGEALTLAQVKSRNELNYQSYKALEKAIEALERQIAKEPEVWANGTEHCPCCEKDVTNMYFKVCIECGQRLKEGEVDE